MSSLKILSGGAAQGLVASLAPTFKKRTGLDIEGEFGAVGAMAGKLRGGQPADIVVLTAALIADLARETLVTSASISDIGRVETAIAVRAGDPLASVDDAASLREVLLGADAIFVPDTKASTAGIHIAKVLRQLGVADQVANRLRIYPNGATAMRHLAASDAIRPIGCTQSTEILNTAGVVLSGSLPPGCELATMYTAAVTTQAADPGHARDLIGLLSGADQARLRERAGFLDAKESARGSRRRRSRRTRRSRRRTQTRGLRGSGRESINSGQSADVSSGAYSGLKSDIR
jgi:molybdate transport system substrate-binding protein